VSFYRQNPTPRFVASSVPNAHSPRSRSLRPLPGSGQATAVVITAQADLSLNLSAANKRSRLSLRRIDSKKKKKKKQTKVSFSLWGQLLGLKLSTLVLVVPERPNFLQNADHQRRKVCLVGGRLTPEITSPSMDSNCGHQ